ncbi:MAG: chloride channel protein [Bacteroidales bacterium]|nr:chloride channel protein [Bacteroidales bacterium]MBN2757646.1 chloride channel protein [Bacteroidales bacterium]
MKKKSLLKSFLIWRIRHISTRPYLMILSLITGLGSGIAAVIIFNLVHLIKSILQKGSSNEYFRLLHIVYPVVGIFLAVIFIKFVIKQRVGHGIPSVLYAISKNHGYISAHNMFSSIITSALTVGFGGSVGLEGPTVATGGAIGSNLGKLLHLTYKHRILLLGCASAGAMAAIFKAPIAAIVFAFEVIMIDLTTASIVPILIAAASGTLTSYFFLGQNVIYPIDIVAKFEFSDLPFYILLGIFAGLVSVYFTRTYMFIGRLFDKIKHSYNKLLIGGFSLGIIILLFPSLYGDGYEAVNQAMHGEYNYLFTDSYFSGLSESLIVTFILIGAVILLKVIATSITFGSGGIGGIFAPTLFMGANLGLLFANFLKHIGFKDISVSNYVLVGMGGLIAGVLHAPLTGLFLIADLTQGYELFMPLMITATISYVTIKYFEANNVYTIQLAKRKELLTHHADKNALSFMKVHKMIETDFVPVDKDGTLGDLVDAVSKSPRNIFPIIDEDRNFLGIVSLNDIRNIMFKPEEYDKVFVKDLMYIPTNSVKLDDTMEDVAHKIQHSGKFNIVVLEDGKYLGFISRANVFSNYRRILKSISAD